MSARAMAVSTLERVPLPDPLTQMGIGMLVGRTSRLLAAADAGATRKFAHGMAAYPIAMNTAEANAQHYEVPAAYFDLVLGPQRKYSCCLYPTPNTSLAEAEELALAETAQHADLCDGQAILELGCGWGSLSLWMARRFPNARILSVSNSTSQRAFIERRALELGLANLAVVTADMNEFDTEGRFDRVVSVEMFEHMANWRPLLMRIRAWLKPEGRFFLHVFAHKSTPYRFDVDDKTDWIARHFFTGGIMPSAGLVREFADLFAVEHDWRWSGEHYARTARHWLANQDAQTARVALALRPVYEAQTWLWLRRWRLFYLATAGLFGHNGGNDWGVSHYRLVPVKR